MSADNRSVSTDALATLGTIIDDKQKRDAIHLAVIPAIARQCLSPGQHVNKDGTSSEIGEGVGIVDPFLQNAVVTGERFWLVIYPRVITSLRHVWAHPAFEDEAPSVAISDPSKAVSEAWLRDFCSTGDCPDYDELMAAIQGKPSFTKEDDGYYGVSVEGDYILVRGSDAHGEIPPEFWVHAEIVTGLKFAQKPTHFSCSC